MTDDSIGAAGAGLPWRRNLSALTAAVFIGFTGFTLVMPFLPLYFQQLGVRDVGEIAFWAGISLGITPAVTALLAPFWGRLADRFGRKIMIQRSLGSFVVVMSVMAYATHAWHVFALRLVQGLFAGYGPMALTMAADNSPRGRMASSIGLVQTAQRLGPAFGPVVGGAVAQVFGLRNAFFVSALFYLLGLLLITFFYREPHRARTVAESRSAPRAGGEVTFRNVLAFEHFLLLMVVIFALQFVDRSFGPVLPLHLANVGVPMARVPVISGIVFSLAAGAGAVGNTVCAPLLRRFSVRAIVAVGSFAAAVAVLAFVLLPVMWAFYVAATAFGVAIGSATTAAYTAGATVIPEEARGAGFGFLTGAYLAALAISPMVAGMLGQASISAVFIVDAVVLVLLASGVSRLMIDRVGPAEAPAQEQV